MLGPSYYLVLLSTLLVQSISSPISNLHPGRNVIPSLDQSVDAYDLGHLVPARRILLRYTSTSDQPGSLIVNVGANTTRPVLILENSAFIKNVICSGQHNTLSIEIRDAQAQRTLLDALSKQADDGIILVTDSESCNAIEERGFYLGERYVVHESHENTTITFEVMPQKIDDFTKTLDLGYESLAQRPNSHGDLRRRSSYCSEPTDCTLIQGTPTNGLRCQFQGIIRKPQGITFQKATDLSSCRNECVRDAKCLSFGWMDLGGNEKVCFTSTTSLAKQEPVADTSVPWKLYDRACWKCDKQPTSIAFTTTTTTKYTTTTISNNRRTSTSASTRCSTSSARTTSSTTSKHTSTCKSSTSTSTHTSSPTSCRSLSTQKSSSVSSKSGSSSVVTSKPTTPISSSSCTSKSTASISTSSGTSRMTTSLSTSVTTSSSSTSSTQTTYVPTKSTSISLTSSSVASSSGSTASTLSTRSSGTSLSTGSSSSTTAASTTTVSSSTGSSSGSSTSPQSTSSSSSTTASSTSVSSSTTSSTSMSSSFTTSSSITTTVSSVTSNTQPTASTSVFTSAPAAASTSDYYDPYTSTYNPYTSTFTYVPPTTNPNAVYSSLSALADYTSLLTKVNYNGNAVIATYIPSSPVPSPTQEPYAIDDQWVAQEVAERLYSLGFSLHDAALQTLKAVATYAAPNIPTSTVDGQDELGGGSIVPTSLSKRSMNMVGIPIKEDVVLQEVKRESEQLVERGADRQLQSPTREYITRDAGDDICEAVGYAGKACEVLDMFGVEETEEMCGVVDIGEYACKAKELFDGILCFFGICIKEDPSSPSAPPPPPPPPPIQWSYDQSFSFSWSLPAEENIYGDSFAQVSCSQCSFDLHQIEFSGTVTIDSVTQSVLHGSTTMRESSLRWLVFGLTTTGPSSGSFLYNVDVTSLGAISAQSLFSITPDMSISFGMSWSVHEAISNEIRVGSEIAVLSGDVYLDFVNKQAENRGGVPTMRTVRPNMLAGDSIQVYSGTAISMNIQSLGGSFASYTSTNIEHSIDFHNVAETGCGATGVAKQAYVVINNSANVGGTTTQIMSISKQLVDQCGITGTLTPIPDSCGGNQGTQATLFFVDSLLPNGGWSGLANNLAQIYEIKPQFTFNLAGIGELYVDNLLYWWPDSGNAYPLWHGLYPISAIPSLMVVQGYVVAETDGLHTFAFNGLRSNQLTGLFFGPASDLQLQEMESSRASLLGFPSAPSTTLTMTTGKYYFFRVVVGYDSSNPSPETISWSFLYPNGSTWMDHTQRFNHYVVQYSCDGTTAPPISGWADF